MISSTYKVLVGSKMGAGPIPPYCSIAILYLSLFYLIAVLCAFSFFFLSSLLSFLLFTIYVYGLLPLYIGAICIYDYIRGYVSSSLLLSIPI